MQARAKAARGKRPREPGLGQAGTGGGRGIGPRHWARGGCLGWPGSRSIVTLSGSSEFQSVLLSLALASPAY